RSLFIQSFFSLPTVPSSPPCTGIAFPSQRDFTARLSLPPIDYHVGHHRRTPARTPTFRHRIPCCTPIPHSAQCLPCTRRHKELRSKQIGLEPQQQAEAQLASDPRQLQRQAPALPPPCNSPRMRAWLHQRMRTAPKRGVGARVFEPTRTPAPRSLARSVWAASSPPKSPSATPESSGVEAYHGAVVTQGAISLTPKALKSASISNAPMDVIPSPTTTSMNALDVVAPLTERTVALSLRRANPLTPYHAEAWRQALSAASLLAKYPSVYSGLTSGFDIGIPCISQMHAPFNSPTLRTYQEVFSSIIYNEFARGRYLGLFSQSELQLLIGPF
ncbi:hypothetical protein EW146_g9849, partial [Bondarzewia mesenterica]